MEAHRSKQFLVDHTFISAAAFGLLVSSVTLFVTLALTGALPGVWQDSEYVTATRPVFNLPDDRAGIGAGVQNWSIGNESSPALGEDSAPDRLAPQDQSAPAGADSAEQFTRFQTRNPGFLTDPEAIYPAPGE